jgi:hypothetical protein
MTFKIHKNIPKYKYFTKAQRLSKNFDKILSDISMLDNLSSGHKNIIDNAEDNLLEAWNLIQFVLSEKAIEEKRHEHDINPTP